MAKANLPITSFNAGIVSKLALSRIDVSRLKFAAEIQDNWMPRTVGPMSLRNGMECLPTSVTTVTGTETIVTAANCWWDPVFTSQLATLTNSNFTLTGQWPPDGAIMGVAVDLDSRKVWVYNPWYGTWNSASDMVGQNPGTGSGGWTYPAISGLLYPACSVVDESVQGICTINGNPFTFRYPIPAGFSAWGDMAFDPTARHPSINLTNSNRTCIGTWVNDPLKNVRATVGRSSGKFYFEVQINQTSPSFTYPSNAIGLQNALGNLNDAIGLDGNGWCLKSYGSAINLVPNTGFHYNFQFNSGFPSQEYRTTMSTLGHSTGKWYFEVHTDIYVPPFSSQAFATGLSTHDERLAINDASGGVWLGGAAGHSIAAWAGSSPSIQFNGSSTGFSNGPIVQGALQGCAVDLDRQLVWFWNSTTGKWNGDILANQNPSLGVGGISFSGANMDGGQVIYAAANVGYWGAAVNTLTGNFGVSAFANTVPDGFLPWGTQSVTIDITQTVLARGEDTGAYPIPFIFAHDDTALIELVDTIMRVRINDVVVTRNAVSTSISDPTFASGAGWTAITSGGATVTIGGGLLLAALPYGSLAAIEQVIPIIPADVGVEQALRIEVSNGPVGFRIGTSSGLSDVFKFSELGTGTHSLAFTPNTSLVYLRFESTERRYIIVSSCFVESSGAMMLPIPWLTVDFDTLAYAQSGDVLYLAHSGYQQRKIERRSTRSWSIVLYEPIDGPFRITPPADLLISPSATDGEINLAASAPYFTTDLEGSLMRLFTSNQDLTDLLGGQDVFSDAIRVTGVAGARAFTYSIGGAWSGTLTLQRSSDSAVSGFTDVQSFSSNTSGTLNDGFDNSIIWYRIGFEVGNYGSGSAVVELTFPGGGHAGYVRINTVYDLFNAQASVMADLSSTNATRDFEEGDWSDKNGWPSAVALYQGRLWWFGQDKIWGSISDAFESFDATVVGDAGTISRTIGYGPVEIINWALPLQRLIIGLQSSEAEIKSSQFDQPLTPTNFSVTDASTQGSVRTPAVKVDTRGVFVQQSRRKLYQLLFNVQNYDYEATDLSVLLPDLDSNFVQLVVQRQPDTRIHALRADGTVMILTYEPLEQVICWTTVSTLGQVLHMAVLPGDAEDLVYYYTKRHINGVDKYYVEKFSFTSECQGGTINKQADCFADVVQLSSRTITGLGYLEGQTVIVWANGKDLGRYVVAGGSITLPEEVTEAIVGLPYVALFRSAKLAYAAQMGTALGQTKRINKIGLILHNTHNQGIEFGQSFIRMDNLPMTYQGKNITPDAIYGDYDVRMVPLPGRFDADSRLHLRATAPRPCTALGAVIALDTHDTDPSPT